jgi:hypothetical protein
MQVTLTFPPIVAWAIQAAADDFNATLPKDEAGQPIGAMTAQQYAETRLAAVPQSWADSLARIGIAAGIARLTAAEFGRINAARAAIPAVADAVRPIFESQSVMLGGALWINGIQTMAAAGLLDTPTQARVDALLAPPQPGESRA